MRICKYCSLMMQTPLRMMVLTACLLLARTAPAHCQAVPTAARTGALQVFVNFGGMKTKVAAYTFNSLGISGGVRYRFSRLLEVDLRAASYPIHARFTQIPITAGLGIADHSEAHPQLFAFAAGGISKAEDAGPHYTTLPGRWSRCWQVGQGMDIPMGRLKWRLYEAVLTETYTPQRGLRSISVSTGLAYRFGH